MIRAELAVAAIALVASGAVAEDRLVGRLRGPLLRSDRSGQFCAEPIVFSFELGELGDAIQKIFVFALQAD